MTLDCYYVIEIGTNKTLFVGFDEKSTMQVSEFLREHGYEIEVNKGVIC